MLGLLRRSLTYSTSSREFYHNSHILRYAAKELAPLSLRQLIFFGKILSRDESNPNEIERNLVQGANFIRAQLPLRLARRIRDFQSLPFIVTSNRHLTETYNLYVEAFEKFRVYPEIKNGEQNEKWCKFLQKLLSDHKPVIPQLAIGMAETASHLTSHQIEQFMTQMLHTRISRRVLAEHHIALTCQFQPGGTKRTGMRYLGIIDTQLEVGQVLERCIKLAQAKVAPQAPSLGWNIKIAGEKAAEFAYIPDHLEYMLFELLLNTFRATIDHATLRACPLSSLPIQIQIASSCSHLNIRISDSAGGIPQPWTPAFADEESFPPTVSRCEMFSFFRLAKQKDQLKSLIEVGGLEGTLGEQVQVDETASNVQEAVDVQEARLRIGLPLSSIFASFFGGSLEMYSIKGSLDVVLSLPKLGTTTNLNPTELQTFPAKTS